MRLASLLATALLASFTSACFSHDHGDPIEGLEGSWFLRRTVVQPPAGCPAMSPPDLDMVIARSEYAPYTLSIQPARRINDEYAESPEMHFEIVEQPFADDRTIDIAHDLRFEGGGTSGEARAFLEVDDDICSYQLDVVGYRVPARP